jgi:hypothetical protein
VTSPTPSMITSTSLSGGHACWCAEWSAITAGGATTARSGSKLEARQPCVQACYAPHATVTL